MCLLRCRAWPLAAVPQATLARAWLFSPQTQSPESRAWPGEQRELMKGGHAVHTLGPREEVMKQRGITGSPLPPAPVPPGAPNPQPWEGQHPLLQCVTFVDPSKSVLVSPGQVMQWFWPNSGW